MNFTIDLLQGKGLPQKSQPGAIALAAIPFLIPLLASGLMAVQWCHTKILTETEQNVLRQNQRHIQQHADDLKQYEQTQRQILQARHNVKNITDALQLEMPASPLLLTLAQTLPEEIFIYKINLDYQPSRQKIVNPKDNKTHYQRVIQRTLRLTLAGPNRTETDQAVDTYMQALRNSECLSQTAQEVQITSRQVTELDNQLLLVYEIKCPFVEQK